MDEKESLKSAVVDDPRAVLSRWANEGDEWIRHLVGQVLASSRPASEPDVEYAYQLFRQSKGLDKRVLPAEPALAAEIPEEVEEASLTLVRLSEVQGVNALSPGAVIEPHAGLTILYGENGTGKTGYSRIFKALAGSRTADEILGDIEASTEVPISATLDYSIGDDAKQIIWKGETGRAPFTRMSIFDSPAVNFHVDDDLEYVYVPSVLSLFNHVSAAVRQVQQRIDDERKELSKAVPSLLTRFGRGSSVYSEIETLGASTDLAALEKMKNSDLESEQKIADLQGTIAALQSDSMSVTLSGFQRQERVLAQASRIQAAIADFGGDLYNKSLENLAKLRLDLETFRTNFFAAADLPAIPDDTWSDFIEAGAAYQEHLETEGVHDGSRCLYCRQPLSEPALDLITRYSDFLLDKIGSDISAEESVLNAAGNRVRPLVSDEMHAFVKEFAQQEKKPDFFDRLRVVDSALTHLQNAVAKRLPVELTVLDEAVAETTALAADKELVEDSVATVKGQVENSELALSTKKQELEALQTGVELAKSWAEIALRVERAKEADRLALLTKPLPQVLRALTELAKTASDHLINENFDTLFIEECDALRAPSLKVEFIGRDGKAKRRKVLTGKHRPSKVLSEGEQKVLAMADFLAEARLSGISAPVIFDDPVSSLDHRRINEVADRIAKLTQTTQVIVFTHDVMFAAALLSRFEQSKRCSFYEVSDENGKGKIAVATGPRWDSISDLAKRVNMSIQSAMKEEGEARDALVRTGYGWLRSWCEVFTEQELLQGGTQRYQPNVRMTTLSKINAAELPAASAVAVRVFEDACRYIDSHSQPLPSLGVKPTLVALEKDWAELQAARKAYLGS